MEKWKMENQKLLLPPFTLEVASEIVQLSEEVWNTKNTERICLAYSVDTQWRNRTAFIKGHQEVKLFLHNKWENELDYKVKKTLWGFRNNRMAVQFEYEWHDDQGQWFRSYGNELLEFDANGLIVQQIASINDVQILATERVLT